MMGKWLVQNPDLEFWSVFCGPQTQQGCQEEGWVMGWLSKQIRLSQPRASLHAMGIIALTLRHGEGEHAMNAIIFFLKKILLRISDVSRSFGTRAP